MLVRNKSREILSKYTVEDVHQNYARISSEIHQVLTGAFAGVPRRPAHEVAPAGWDEAIIRIVPCIPLIIPPAF